MTDIFRCFTLLCLTFSAYKYYAYHNYYVGHSTYEYAILSISSPVFLAEKRLFTACFPIFRRCFIISRDIRPAFFHSRITPKKKRRKKARRYFIKVYSLSFLRFICLLLLFS